MRTLVKNSAGRFVRPAHLSLLVQSVAAALVLTALPAEAFAQASPVDIQAAVKSAGKSARDVRTFYEARGNRPLWIRGTAPGPEAEQLLRLIETAHLDGLDRGDYRYKALASALKKARSGSPKALARAELLLSQSFARYVADVRRPRQVGMIYADPQLAPGAPAPQYILQAAGAAPSLRHYLESAGWMHPIYGQLRRALEAHWLGEDGPAYGRPIAGREQQERLLRLNLERARALPPSTVGRHVLVDAASARLWLYEDGRVKDSMRVVVGKPSDPTPMMAGLIRYTTVNPYWNVPPDLVRERIAPHVLKSGLSYLRTKRYEVLSDWSDKPKVLNPAKIDWKAVAAGREELRVRQRPGGDNAMGKMKFMFPNALGIYLHDTPDKELFVEADRVFSAGCVRVEDAPRLAKWLYNGKQPKPRTKAAEQQVDLPEPVPVYITYLTAAPESGRIAYRSDVYNRDGALMAQLGGRARGSR